MEGRESGARSHQAPAAQEIYSALLLQAAGIIRLRYVNRSHGTTLSPTAATELAKVFEGVAKGDPEFDQVDPKEAIALAHRLMDDDHPELSSMWPRTR